MVANAASPLIGSMLSSIARVTGWWAHSRNSVPDRSRAISETNFFGALEVIRAARCKSCAPSKAAKS